MKQLIFVFWFIIHHFPILYDTESYGDSESVFGFQMGA